jgi:fumarate reductase subunit D
MLAGLTAWLAGNGIVPNILAFKVLPGLFHLTSIAVVVVYLRKIEPERSLAGALVLSWNPVVLYETWGNGHNDIAMIFWVLLAALLIYQKRYTWSVLALVAGALVKFIPILLVPAAMLIGYRSLENLSSRICFILRTLIAALLLTIVAYLPFWNGLASFSIGRRMQMFTTSIPAVIYRILKPDLGFSESARLVSLGALGLLTIFTLFQTFQSQRQEPTKGFLQTAFHILAFYLMVTCLWFQQWYSVWLLALAPLLSQDRLRFSILFGFWVLSKQLIFGPLVVPIMFHHPQTAIWLEPVLVLSVFGVPWFYALLLRRFSKQTKQMNYAT